MSSSSEPTPYPRLRLWITAIPVVALIVFAGYYYRNAQEFEVTGQVLYRNAIGIQPVRGAHVEVYDNRQQPKSVRSRYSLLLLRQFELRLSPEYYTPNRDNELSALRLAPLSKMSWSQWESERLRNCSWATQVFLENLVSPMRVVATTSTDMDGRFWLKLKRGKYFITVASYVPTFWRVEHDPVHSADTSERVDGNVFWNMPVSVSGDVKIVSAEPDCDPGP